MSKKKKKGTNGSRTGKITMKGIGESAGQKLLPILLGVIGAYALHQGYQQFRPAVITPNATPGTSGIAGIAITYAEPLLIGGAGLVLMQMAKKDFWKLVWLGLPVYGGAKILNNAGRDFFKLNLLGNIDANDNPVFNPGKQLPANNQPARVLSVQFPEMPAVSGTHEMPAVSGTQDEQYHDMMA